MRADWKRRYFVLDALGHLTYYRGDRDVRSGSAKETVRLLIARRANVHQALMSGHTTLMAAAQNGRDEIVQLLIDVGADREAVRDDGMNAMMLAEEYGRLTTSRLLRGGEKQPTPDDPFRYPDPRKGPMVKRGSSRRPRSSRTRSSSTRRSTSR